MEQPFEDAARGIRGTLHAPESSNGDAIVLTHGAGSSSQAPLLVKLARAFQSSGFSVLRCDLPFRQKRRHGPPHPSGAAQDREGLQSAVVAMRERIAGRIFLGGHSYGGRQASMLAASQPGFVEALLLLSYPLHPPNRPENLRTQHFPELRTSALFVHGTRDPFGSLEEMGTAIALIPAPTSLLAIDGAGHSLERIDRWIPAIVARLSGAASAAP
jgi:predicted alpha/beta-hydrolase family hydrolase